MRGQLYEETRGAVLGAYLKGRGPGNYLSVQGVRVSLKGLWGCFGVDIRQVEGW